MVDGASSWHRNWVGLVGAWARTDGPTDELPQRWAPA